MAELAALGLQRLGGLFDVLRGTGGGVGVGLHAGDVVRDVLGALRCILRAAGDLLGRSALFLHGGGNRGGNFVDLADDAADRLCLRIKRSLFNGLP